MRLSVLPAVATAIALTLPLFPLLATPLPEQTDPISIDLADADVEKVLESFARMAESELELDPRVEGTVTIRLDRVSWMTALDALCQSAGCRWRLWRGKPNTLQITPTADEPERPMTISVERVDIKELFEAICKITSCKLDLDDRIEGKLSLNIQDVATATALSAVCENIGCKWSLLDDPSDDGVRTLEVVPGPERATGRAPEAGLDQRINLDLVGADIRETLAAFSKILDSELVLPDDLRGLVSLRIESRSVADTLDQICRFAGCRWTLDESPTGSRLVVESLH